MKGTRIKTISAILSLTFFLAVLTGCVDLGTNRNSYLPEDYTGGFGIPFGSGIEYYWVETYEECVSAIELLKSHGSTFDKSVFFAYEGELFDTKFCFIMDRRNSDRIAFGDNPYDRKSVGVSIESCAFFEDVEIDELVYSYISHYNAYAFYMNHDNADEITEGMLSSEQLRCEFNSITSKYEIYSGDNMLFGITYLGQENAELSDDCINAIIGSLKIVHE